MPISPAELLRDWHDFYVLAGTGSATLVGLMFVAASIGASYFTERHRLPLTAFLTPTVMHFAAVLFICLVVMIPIHDWHTIGGLLGAIGLAGVIYCGRILLQIIVGNRFKVDFGDRLFYALVPPLGHLLLLTSAVLLFSRCAAGSAVLAAALLTLLVAGIRNAWDMTLWIAIKAPTPGTPPPQAGV